MKLFQNLSTGLAEEVVFICIYSPGGHFVQQSGTVLAILVDSHLRNISV